MMREQRWRLDAASGSMSFDEGLERPPSRRLRVLWLENTLDCRMWGYYCDIKKAMERLHDLCVPYRTELCQGTATNPFVPDVAIVGPRYSINVNTEDDPVGFDRLRFARVPLLVLQNKMYVPNGWREIVGNVTAKLQWVRAAGAAAAFTWITRHHTFTQLSGVPHHWMPFGVDVATYAVRPGAFGKEAQPYDVGFTGASGADKYPLRSSMLREIQSMNVSGFFGTWSQTALNRNDPHAWKAGDHADYAVRIARARIWLSTTGPSQLVGTRYFEILASGTTLLMCNRPKPGEWVYDGLFEDGVHVVMFDDVADLHVKVLQYLRNESARQKIVTAAYELTRRIHSWDARARFITRVAEMAILRQQSTASTVGYVPPPKARSANDSSYVGCFLTRLGQESAALRQPLRSRNARRLHRYTVASCEAACSQRGVRTRAHTRARGDFASSGNNYAALVGGGFTTGNGHTLAKCMCAAPNLTRADGWRRRPDAECSTVCSLHDARPCGGYRAVALFRPPA